MFARTQRLTLRPPWPEDASDLTMAIAHEAVATSLAQLPWPYRRADAEAWLSLSRGATDPVFVILDMEEGDPQLIGGIGLQRHGDAHEIGYWLTPAAWGRGFATEACRAVIDLARQALAMKRLAAGHFIDNPASGRVLRKLGFHESGREQRHCLARGGEIACTLYELDLAENRIAAGFAG